MKSQPLLFLPLVVLLLAGLACGGSPSAAPGAPTTPTARPARSNAATWPVNTPDATATPAFTAEETEYATLLRAILDVMSQAMQSLGEQSTAAGENPALILEDDWRTRTAVALGVIKGEVTEIRKLKAPARFADVQAELLVAAGHFEKMTTLYAEAIDEMDGDKMTRALNSLTAGTESLNAATAKLELATSAPLPPPTGKPSQQVLATKAPVATSAAQKSQPTATSQTKAAKGANLRGGPGTTFPIVGTVKAGDPLEIVGKNAKGDWYKLAGGDGPGRWIAAFLVSNPPDVPVVDAPESSAPAATAAPAAVRSGAVAVPVAKGPPTAGDSDCTCDRNTLNCDDFPASGWEAQACYLRCKELTGRDVHGLDRDSDGDACEWTWSD